VRIVHLAKMTGVAGTENHLLTLLPQLANSAHDVRLLVLCEPEQADVRIRGAHERVRRAN
jgi:hypothetical protein